MSFSIGLRFYRIQIRKQGSKNVLGTSEDIGGGDLFHQITNFVNDFRNPVVLEEEERTWFFEPVGTSSVRTIHGSVRYGTTGFESKLVDSKTKAENYLRKVTDVEEIPLYFQFWIPADENFGLLAFQSFQGRSCIFHVQDAARKYIEEKAIGYTLNFRKLMPYQIGDDRFLNAPLKELRFVKKSVPNDIADRYLHGMDAKEVDFEVVLKAKRRKSLGLFKDIAKVMPADKGVTVIMADGVGFDAVKAGIDVGGKRRVVGLFGSGEDAGVIEVTDKVPRGRNGHPSFDDLTNEVDELMEFFFASIKGG